MAVDPAGFVGDFDTTLPTDDSFKAEAPAQMRETKVALKASFPNVHGAVISTETELNYVDGVTSAIQPQIDAKAPLASPALTGTPTAPTAAPGATGTQMANLDYVQGELSNGYAKVNSPHFTGLPTAPTATAGTTGGQIATLDFVAAAGFAAVLPGQGTRPGVLRTDGAGNASFQPDAAGPVFSHKNFGGL